MEILILRNKNNVVILSLLLLIVVIQLLKVSAFTDDLSIEIIRDTTIRLIFSVALIILMYYLGHSFFMKSSKPFTYIAFIVFPALLIAINNFPISAYFFNRVTITEPAHTLYLFAIECLSVGIFEEIIFRGIIFAVLVQQLPQTRAGGFIAILISSILFGFMHLLNLFNGANIASVLIQVGYSILVGAMLAVVYVATQNLIYPILIHGIYNYFGLVAFRFGIVNSRYDVVTIVVTIVLSLFSFVFYYIVFMKTTKSEIEKVYLVNRSKTDV